MKRLLPYTVIPSDLYVQRSADRQLVANIQQMERPAYILVARQMGKTNLLLHTKQIVENETDKVIYVDLSTSFSDERECFRRMIDHAIESCGETFSHLTEKIDAGRKLNKPPTREHDSEIRLLLRGTTGKVVIILDEIDSLTNADFSDRIFAHIRSVYFSRATFPELSRLTYVLSGVVEPNDIIKDKKISPFNIGEKIYLDDFSFEEFTTLITNAGLNFDLEEISRIYYWTSGNPRMAWDLCSSFEDSVLLGSRGQLIVDECVQKLYLNDFDHAPIDHIRQLVRENNDIRTSVWDIVNGNESQVNASGRTRLYLSGIIKNTGDSILPKLKNEVIKRALSVTWLQDLVMEQRSLHSLAQDRYDRDNFSEALELFKKYLELEASDVGSRESAVIFYQMGRCALNLRRYEEAIEHYSAAAKDKNGLLYRQSQLYCGICSIYLRNYNDAISYLSAVDPLEICDETGLQAYLNLGSAHLGRAQQDDFQLALSIFESFPDLLQRATEDIAGAEDWLTFSLFSQGRAKQKLNDLGGARSAFLRATESSKTEFKPTILLQLALCEVEPEAKKQILSNIATDLTAGSLEIESQSIDRPLAFKESNLVDLIEAVASLGMDTCLGNLETYLTTGKNGTNLTFATLLVSAGEQSLSRGGTSAGTLFEWAVEKAKGDSGLQLSALRWLVLLETNKKYNDPYLATIESLDGDSGFSFFDMKALANMTIQSVISSDWSKVERITSIAERFRATVDPRLLRNYLGFDFARLLCFSATGRNPRISSEVRSAERFIKNLPSSIEGEYLCFSSKDLETSRDYILRLAKRGASIFTDSPVVKIASRPRNSKIDVKYVDGTVKHGVKFKVVEGDLRSGKCIVIE